MDVEKAQQGSRELDTKTEVCFVSQRSVDTGSEVSSRRRSSWGSMAHHHHDRSWYSKRLRKRLIHKNGECNVSNINIKKRHQSYLADIFTTLVDIKWRWNLLLFVLAFTLSWMMFAGVWWLICFSHGDIDNANNGTWIPCVNNVNDFNTALLFSIETQHTIGYGSRSTTSECAEAIIVMMLQSCFGVIIQALMTGLVFAKLSRSKKRSQTLMFSKRAVISSRDGHLSLLFRVGDMRRSNIIQATVRGLLVKKHITQEGEILPLAEFDVPFGTEGGANELFLVWPLILDHRIDECSPFYDISANDLHNQTFELVIILEGVIESTGMTTQARTSYLPSEISWGHRFERLVAYQKENGHYIIDFSRFNNIVKVDCQTTSVKQTAEGYSPDTGFSRSTSIGNNSLGNISEESSTGNTEQMLNVLALESLPDSSQTPDNSQTALVQLHTNSSAHTNSIMNVICADGVKRFDSGDCVGYDEAQL